MYAALKYRVENATKSCRDIIESKDFVKAKKKVKLLSSVYEPYIPDIGKHLSINDPESITNSEYDYLGDLVKIEKMLQSFHSSKCQPINQSIKNETVKIDNYNPNTNNNKIKMEINITFEQVKKDIAKNGNLPQQEIEEILARINEIDLLANSQENRNQKWVKLKSTLDWLSTKNVDIAAKFLPLLMKTVESQEP
jgi:hypothetical protein